MKLPVLIVSAATSVLLFAGETVSKSGCRIDADPEGSLLWKTVLSDEIELFWRNPSFATSAKLSLVGIKDTRSVVFSKGETSYSFSLPPCSSEEEEDVYTFRLEFYNGDALLAGETIEAAGIGRVRGVGAGSGVRVIGAGDTDRSWKKVYGGKAVLPVWNVKTERMSVDGKSVEAFDVPGWYGVAVGSGVQKAVALCADAHTYDCTLLGVQSGLNIVIR